jgi:hypothetical protein
MTNVMDWLAVRLGRADAVAWSTGALPLAWVVGDDGRKTNRVCVYSAALLEQITGPTTRRIAIRRHDVMQVAGNDFPTLYRVRWIGTMNNPILLDTPIESSRRDRVKRLRVDDIVEIGPTFLRSWWHLSLASDESLREAGVA